MGITFDLLRLVSRLKSSFVRAFKTEYTHLDSKLLASVFCFEELVETGLWGGGGWVKQLALYTFSAKKNQALVPKLKC